MTRLEIICLVLTVLSVGYAIVLNHKSTKLRNHAKAVLMDSIFLASVIDYMLSNKYVGTKKVLKAIERVKIAGNGQFDHIDAKIKEPEEEDIPADTPTRVCKKCGKVLPITDFEEIHLGTGWRRHTCKECIRAKKRQIYKDNV